MGAVYLEPEPGGRIVGSLAEARLMPQRPGDVVEIRDLAGLAPPETVAAYRPRRYSLASGASGTMFALNERDGAVPPVIDVDLGLEGWHAIHLGVPKVDLRPRITFPSGIDAALDGDPFVHVGPEFGSRGGRMLGPVNVEVSCFWTCADLTGRRLRLRSPFGARLPWPWGLVRAQLSSIRLVRLSEGQVRAYRAEAAAGAQKPVIVVDDGFSRYWYGVPGNDIDARLVETFRDSDVKVIFLQTPSTGVASWPSQVTSLLGGDLTEEDWKDRRLGDRRVYDYLSWASASGREGMRVVGERCRKLGIAFHASLRMNLFWRADGHLGKALDRMLNGSWWIEHPEARKPEGPQIDFGHPEARRWVVELLRELATTYDVSGINLDFTRWPPIADPERHDDTVLTGLVREVRSALDGVERAQGTRLALSATVVEGYHARDGWGRRLTLADQRIDLEGWIRAGRLDFVCVEAWDHTAYRELARAAGIPYYIVHDGESVNVPGGFREDPSWSRGDAPNEDPVPGEETAADPPLNSSLDPTEYDELIVSRRRYEADGLCIPNNFMGWRCIRRLGHWDEARERMERGERWGQRIGERITFL